MTIKQNPNVSCWCLRIAAALCFFSSAFQYQRFSNTVFSYLLVELGLTESTCDIVVLMMVWCLALSTLAVLIPKKTTTQIGLLGTAVLFIEATALTIYPPEWISIFNLTCHALRILTPVALVFLWHGRSAWAVRVLCIASALTFMGHGAKALNEDVLFLDYILAFWHDLGSPIDLKTGILLLHIIGTIDFALAHHATFFHQRRILWVFRYMTFWGLITACARITFMGWGSWHEVLVRAPHFLGPLFLWGILKRVKSS